VSAAAPQQVSASAPAQVNAPPPPRNIESKLIPAAEVRGR
jgi:hypothetical protein